MKKLLSVVLIICLAIVPFIFAGCGSDYSAADISAQIAKLKNPEAATSQFFTGNTIQVNYTSPAIREAIANSSSPAYVLDYVYGAMLKSASSMILSKSANSNFESIVNKFSSGDRNTIYNELVKLGTALEDLAIKKEIFDVTNNTTSSYLEEYLGAYTKVLKSVVIINSSFAKAYYETTLSAVDFTNSANILQGLIEDVILYNRAILNEVSFNYYVNNYTFDRSHPLSDWLSRWTYFNDIKNATTRTVIGAGYAANRTAIQNIMITLKDTQALYLFNKSLFEKSFGDFDYTDYYYRTILQGYNASAYINEATVSQRYSFSLAGNFMSTYNNARVGGLNQLITLYN